MSSAAYVDGRRIVRLWFDFTCEVRDARALARFLRARRHRGSSAHRIAVSIGAASLPRESHGPTRTYMSPVVFHFAVVLFVAAVALVPSHTPASLGLLLGGAAVVGIVYAAFIIRRLITDNIAYSRDVIGFRGGNSVVPTASFFAMKAGQP